MLGEDLNEAIRYCRSLSLRTRCVTNGYWAKSLKGGRQRLAGLKNAGLNELNISTGDYYQQFVSVEAVENAALLGVEQGMEQTLVLVEVHKGRETTAKTLWDRPEISRLRVLGDAKFKIIESPWISTSLEVNVPQSEPYLINRINVHLRQPCSSMLRTFGSNPL